MKKKTDCNECRKRPDCNALCATMDRRVRSVEHHFRGEEILVTPAAVTALFMKNGRRTIADLGVEEIGPSDIRVIPGLTTRQLRVLTMSLAGRMTNREIAGRLGLNQSTAGECLLNARRKARRYLEAYLRTQTRGGRPIRYGWGKKAR